MVRGADIAGVGSHGSALGTVSARGQLRGTSLPVVDGLIAATAPEHDLTLVTWNAKDFTGSGVALANPWD